MDCSEEQIPSQITMLKDYFKIAFKNLKHRGLRSWLTILGVFIGIAAVVSLISLSNGLEQAVMGQFKTLTGDKLIVQSSTSFFGPPGTLAVRKLNEHDLDLIKSVNGVDMAIPRLLRSTKIEFNEMIGFKYLASMPDNQEQINYIYDTMDLKTAAGRLLKAGDKGKIIIGSDFIKKEEFGKEVKVGTRLKIQNKSLEVVGILEKSSSLEVNNAALVIEEDLEEMLDIDDEIDLILVKVESKDRVEEVANLIKKTLRRDRNQKEGEEDFSVQTPVQALQSINTILGILNLIVSGIAAISLIIGGIGIANTMYTSVLERTREIGVMKAVGARNSEILAIFIIEAGLLGLVGGIIGALVGLGFAFGVSHLANTLIGQNLLLVSVSYPLVGLAIGFAFIIGLISGITPALQASKLKPSQALRA
ncbi:MAG: ABC transporter permease [Candidatus Pacearchaeota archaeon]